MLRRSLAIAGLALAFGPGVALAQDMVSIPAGPFTIVAESTPRVDVPTEALPLWVSLPPMYTVVAFGPLAAAAILVTLPVLIVTVLVQRQIVVGMKIGRASCRERV